MKLVINYFLNDINTVEFSAIDNRGVTEHNWPTQIAPLQFGTHVSGGLIAKFNHHGVK